MSGMFTIQAKDCKNMSPSPITASTEAKQSFIVSNGATLQTIKISSSDLY